MWEARENVKDSKVFGVVSQQLLIMAAVELPKLAYHQYPSMSLMEMNDVNGCSHEDSPGALIGDLRAIKGNLLATRVELSQTYLGDYL